MLDHMGFGVSDYARSRAFYEQALAPLGITVVMEVTPEQAGGHAAAGFGTERKPFFWIASGDVSGSIHVAFAAESRADAANRSGCVIASTVGWGWRSGLGGCC